MANYDEKMNKWTWVTAILNILTCGIYGAVCAVALMVYELKHREPAIGAWRYVMSGCFGILVNFVTLGFSYLINMIVFGFKRIERIYEVAYFEDEEA